MREFRFPMPLAARTSAIGAAAVALAKALEPETRK
jgi:hypothetical protein